jgi:dienelactone hydrolase
LGPSEISERKRLTGALYKDRKRMRMLMDGALKEAKKIGLNTSNAGAVGYCFGGTSVLEWAKSGVALKGIASFHGDMSVKENDTYKKTKAKIAVYHGTADKVVSMQSFADFAILLESEKIPHEMVTYSGAPHAFTKFGTDRYRKEADLKSWKHFVTFLSEEL